MGVSGCGKSTLAVALTDATGWTLVEGDELHPPENVAAMAAGLPLTDADRRPWLAAVGRRLADERRAGRSAVAACSALRRSYRDLVRDQVPDLRVIHLAAGRAALDARLRARTGHFMPASLLDSQLAILEPLEPDEPGLTLDALLPPAELVRRVLAALVPPATGGGVQR